MMTVILNKALQILNQSYNNKVLFDAGEGSECYNGTELLSLSVGQHIGSCLVTKCL